MLKIQEQTRHIRCPPDYTKSPQSSQPINKYFNKQLPITSINPHVEQADYFRHGLEDQPDISIKRQSKACQPIVKRWIKLAWVTR